MAEMQTIGALVATLPATNSCAVARSESDRALLAQWRGKWGRTATVMLKRFNPGVQRYCAANIDRCFTGDAPSLWQVRKAYGRDALDSWLDIQLTDLVNFCGVKGKEEFSRITDAVVAVIADNFGYLKLSELMLFFQRFKAGHYGHFYGMVDPLVITEALQVFLEYRADKLAAIERKRRKLEQQQREVDRAEQERRGELLTADEWKDIGWLFNM